MHQSTGDMRATRAIVGKLRQVWGLRSAAKREARKASLVKREKVVKVGRRGKKYVGYIEYHRCVECRTVKMRRLTHVDHIDPIVPTGEDGPKLAEPGLAKGFDRWLSRCWCPATNLQVLCIPCHRKKTSAESIERKNRK